MEIGDISPNLQTNKNSSTYSKENNWLNVRKLFAAKLPINVIDTPNTKRINTAIARIDLFPLQILLNCLVSLFSVDYIRKLFKKKSLAELYCKRNYGLKLLPNFAAVVCDGVTSLGKANADPEALERVYNALVKEDPSLSSYQFNDLHVG